MALRPQDSIPVFRGRKFHDWPFSAGSGRRPPGQEPTISTFGGGTIPYTKFAKNAIQGLVFTAHINHDLAPDPEYGRPHVHVYAPSAPGIGADTVILRMTYQVRTIKGAYGPEVPETLPLVIGGIRGHILSFPQIPAADLAIGNQMTFLVQRIGNDGADNYDDDLIFEEFDVHLQRTSLGTVEEF